VNDFTDSISPLKLKEYLITGKPVVTTPLAEAKPFAQYMIIATTVEEWRKALVTSLSIDQLTRQKSIVKVMEHESWKKKAQVFLKICTQSNSINSNMKSKI
ncbi:MAG: hypothetical protein KDC97_12560, partial [Confluentibacter sp.]|nr:hypothetical protein [Confluentibacter sp.]